MSQTRAATVLLVDDDETSRLLVQLLLEQAGIDVVEADSAESGLELCRAQRFDLCLIDGMLPRMDGFQMVSALRNVAGYRGLPLVILSGLDGPEWPARAIAAGATRFLHKSSDWDELVKTVQQLIAASPYPVS